MNSFFYRTRTPIVPDAPQVIELFSGGGGWAAGFEMAGFESTSAVEFDPTNPKLSGKLADCHELNFPNCQVIRESVQSLNSKNWQGLPKNQILVASPVCANFSNQKVNATEQTIDIEMAEAVAGAIATLTPRVFVLEQVERYARSQSWQIIRGALINNGYNISSQVVNMRDWGIPQLSRKRFIVVASKEFKFEFPRPLGICGSWWDAISGLELPESELLSKQKDAIASYTGNRNLPLLVQRVGNRGKCRVFPGHGLAPTLTKSIFCDGKGDERSRFFDIVFPDGGVKALTRRGAARIQGFPDWWIPSCGAAIGYAVPPYFTYLLFKKLRTYV